MNQTPDRLIKSPLSGRNAFASQRFGLVVVLVWATLVHGMTITRTSCRVESGAELKNKTSTFSWALESNRQGDSQTAYRIVVNRLWDSGKVVSDQSVNFAYAGGVQMPSCQGPVGEWFIRNLGGIQLDPMVPGFKHTILRPNPVGRLEWVRATHQSGHGQICCSWRKQPGQFTWDITIPANTSATICQHPTPRASPSLAGRWPGQKRSGLYHPRLDMPFTKSVWATIIL